MSQRVVEGLLGRLLTDEDFRHRFYLQPAATCRDGGFDLTSRELEALLGLDEADVSDFAKRLAPRIVRAAFNQVSRLLPQTKETGDYRVARNQRRQLIVAR
jgi:hypothetical protein